MPPTPDELEAARLAGWDSGDGDPPHTHTLPPPVDPEVGNNGIPPTDAEPLFNEDGSPREMTR